MARSSSLRALPGFRTRDWFRTFAARPATNNRHRHERQRLPCRFTRRRLRLPMPIVRILLVLLALASPALAQDGARDAAAALTAEQAFRVYVEGVTKNGGRPDLIRPEVAALLGRVFDLGDLSALPPGQASDLPGLVN